VRNVLGQRLEARLTVMSVETIPVVVEVLRFENLSLASLASRRAVVRWSDGSEGEALRWYSDEIKFSEGDHGNSRLMSPRAEMHRAAGSVRALRGT